MDVDALRNELMEMEWNALREKAKTEHAIKVLPEHKRVDLVNMILSQVHSGKDSGVYVPKGDKVRPGFARIVLLDAADEPNPFYVNVNGYSATIPRNVEVEVPHELLPSLDAMTYKGLKPDESGVLKPYIKRRAPYTVVQKDDSRPSGKMKFVERRERALDKKRRYFEKYDIWPTDGELKEHLKVSGIKDLYPDGHIPAAS